MKYYKNKKDDLFAFDQESNNEGLTEITKEEAQIMSDQISLDIFNKSTYSEKRKTEYPSIQEQLDMQYWDKINGTSVWSELIASIKEKYPKPNMV